jgi:hypothetical protein
MAQESWFDYFSYSMHSLDMPVPSGLFADAVSAVGTIGSLQRAVALAGGTGGDVTIADLVGAGTIPEAFTAVGGVLAAAYAGALVGASIYASACVAEDWFSSPGASDVDTSSTDVSYWQAQGAAVAASATGGTPSATPGD